MTDNPSYRGGQGPGQPGDDYYDVRPPGRGAPRARTRRSQGGYPPAPAAGQPAAAAPAATPSRAATPTRAATRTRATRRRPTTSARPPATARPPARRPATRTRATASRPAGYGPPAGAPGWLRRSPRRLRLRPPARAAAR